jgi:pectate lyase
MICTLVTHVEKSRIMRKMTFPMLLLALAGAAFAADQATEQSIELKDGGQILIQKSVAMTHTDAKGQRVIMADGNIMEAKGGSKIMMKNNALWQTIAVKGTLHPNH